MLNIFSVGIAVHLVDKVSGALGVMSRNMMGAQHSADALNKKMGSIHSKFMAGATMMAGGAALAAPLIHATNQAAELETMLKQVQLVAKGSAGEMKVFEDSLAGISNSTIFSMKEIAQMGREMAAGGIKSVSDINALLPMYASAAEVLYRLKNESPDHTVHSLTKLAHQFGRYTPEEMKEIVETVVKLAPRLPGGIGGFASMGGYVNMEAYRVLGVSPEKLLTLQAAAMQTAGGGGGRGPLSGAALAAALGRLVPGKFGSGMLQGKTGFALQTMGLVDQHGLSTVFNKSGRLDIDLLMQKMAAFHDKTMTAEGRKDLARLMLRIAPDSLSKNQYADQMPYLMHVSKTGAGSPAEIQERLLAWAFGVTGGRAMVAFADPKFQEQYRFMQDFVKSQKGIEQMQKELLDTTGNQWLRFITNVNNIIIELVKPNLPMIKMIISKLGDIAFTIHGIIKNNPGLAKFLFMLTAISSAVLIIGGASLMLQAVFMGLKFLAPAAPYILAAVVAITALTLAIQNWPKITHWVSEVVSKNITTIKFAFAALLTIFPPLSIAVKTFNFLLHHHKEIMQFVSEKWVQLGSIMANTMNSIIGLANQLLSTFHIQLPTINSPTVQNWSDSVLKEHGFNTEPIKPMASKRTSNNQTINYNPTINMQVPHGVNMKDTEKMLKEVLDKHVRKIARATTSGGGNFNSYAHQGA